MDDISTDSLLIVLAVLICISAFFSGTETAMMSLNRYRLRHLAQSGNRCAKRADGMLQRPDRLIGLILIGNNIVNIGAATIATIVCERWFGSWGPAVATGGLTFIILIFAEVTPKTLAALYPERVAFPNSAVLKPLMTLFYPFVWMVNKISNGLLALMGVKTQEAGDDKLSPDELRSVVHDASGLIPRRHKEMLVSILDLEKVKVEDIMIPRAELYAIDINDDYKAIMRQLTRSPHTRVLLYRDNIDELVGVMHLSDVLRLITREQGELDKSTLLRAVEEVYFIPEGTPLNVQLLKFQRAKERMGVVVDEYGDIQGLVTLEDILEEIVGDFTTGLQGPPSEDITQESEQTLLVDASITLRDFNRETKWELPTDGPKTLNGLILEQMEDIPPPGTTMEVEGHKLEVVEVCENKVTKVRLQKE